MITFSIEPTNRTTTKPWKLQILLSPNYQAIYYLNDPQEAKAILEFMEVKNNQQNSQLIKKLDLSFAGLVCRSQPTTKSQLHPAKSLSVPVACGDRG